MKDPIMKKELKKFLATGCDILGACIFNGNIIFAVFFERGDLTKSKIIVNFVLGLVGLLNDKNRNISYPKNIVRVPYIGIGKTNGNNIFA